MDCSASFVIGKSNNLGFGFTTLSWKLLYAKLMTLPYLLNETPPAFILNLISWTRPFFDTWSNGFY